MLDIQFLGALFIFSLTVKVCVSDLVELEDELQVSNIGLLDNLLTEQDPMRGGARKISKCSITALQYNFPLYSI